MSLPRFEKELLMASALGVPREYLLSHPESFNNQNPIYLGMVRRREKNEPLAYILGNTPFLGININVNKNVLIPRPETEELVEYVIGRLKEKTEPLNIADICTGSGCIAVAIAKIFSNSQVLATDISQDALEVAKTNSEQNNVSKNIKLFYGSLLSPIAEQNIRFDAIISNPPYILSKVIPTLMPDVKDWEPILALDGGDDGLKFIKRIIVESIPLLKDNGFLALEIGYDQGDEVENFGLQYFKSVEIKKDLSGNDRIAVFK